MLSYLHAYHAGNIADVQKHAALSLTLSMMQAKPSAIACFDTHAGRGLYDLQDERARKTAEADSGIQRVWAVRNTLVSDDWQHFLQPLEALNRGGSELRYYPGSPRWFCHWKRAQDALTLFELHGNENDQLHRKVPLPDVRIRHEDGLKGLLRSLPPAAPRLLVLMDPSYEIRSDYADTARTLARAWRQCRHGVYLVWYPILLDGGHQVLLDLVAEGQAGPVIRHELRLQSPPERGMIGSGMLVLNPPWQWQHRLEAMLAPVCGADMLASTQQWDWLVPE